MSTSRVGQHKKKAANPLNQESLNKLIDLSSQDKFSQTENYKKLFSKAIKSLAQTNVHIQTYDEAKKLPGVGPFLAQLMTKEESAATQNMNETTEKRTVINTPKTASRILRQCTSISSSASCTSVSKKEIEMELTKRNSDKVRSEITIYKSWNVILLLDQREHYCNQVQSKILQLGIDCEQRSLPIGDMLWIARGENPVNGATVEVLLGTIIERKTSSDLASSLHGTRYEEQRLRLRNNTIGIHERIFLIEAKTLTNVSNCPAKTLRSSIESTRFHLGFHILRTESLEQTCQYLKRLHSHICKRSFPSSQYKDTIPQLTGDQSQYTLYEELKLDVELARERGTRSIGAVFGAMLKQIDSMSIKKVQALQRHYPTPSHLYNAFCECGSAVQFCHVLANIHISESERVSKIGEKSAKELMLAFFDWDANGVSLSKDFQQECETNSKDNISSSSVRNTIISNEVILEKQNSILEEEVKIIELN